jgi:hypothetical protein
VHLGLCPNTQQGAKESQVCSDVITQTITYQPQRSTLADIGGGKSVLATVQNILKPLFQEKKVGLLGMKMLGLLK